MKIKMPISNNLKCPKCGVSELETRVHRGVNIDFCSKCNGIWLDKGELDKISHPHAGNVEYCSLYHVDENRISDFCCPLCRDVKLKEANFICYSSIVIEYCTNCEGFWLDRGKLYKINAEIDKIKKDDPSRETAIMVFLSDLSLWIVGGRSV